MATLQKTSSFPREQASFLNYQEISLSVSILLRHNIIDNWLYPLLAATAFQEQDNVIKFPKPKNLHRQYNNIQQVTFDVESVKLNSK